MLDTGYWMLDTGYWIDKKNPFVDSQLASFNPEPRTLNRLTQA
jgi:hypothetical protein